MITSENFLRIHVLNNFIEKRIVWSDDYFGCFFHNVEEIVSYFGDAVGLMMS